MTPWAATGAPKATSASKTLTAPTTFAGHPFRAGTQLLIPIWLLHRDPRSFAEPTRFLPDRWLDGTADAAPRGAYLPFGGGPRICIGQHFAMIEAVLALACLSRELHVTAHPGLAGRALREP